MGIENEEKKEAVNIFLEECEEILESFDTLLVEYEKTKNKQIITDLKRNAHSIKGSAGIVGLVKIQDLAHKAEDLLADLPNKPDNNIKEIIDKVLDLTDNIKLLIKTVKDNSEKTVEELLNDLIKNTAILKSNITIADKLIVQINELSEKNTSSEFSEVLSVILKIIDEISKSQKIKDASIINILSGAFKTLKKITYENESINDLIFLKQKLNLSYQMIDGYLEKKNQQIQDTATAPTTPHKIKKRLDINVLENLQQGDIRTLRVETSKIDKLYANVQNLEQELFELNQNLVQAADSYSRLTEKIFNFELAINNLKSYKDIKKISAEIINMQKNIEETQKVLSYFENCGLYGNKAGKTAIEKINEIKNSIKSIRILPIGVILHMFPRMARDIATSLGKEVEFEITGGQISVDKSIIEEIKMPLLHILRNAVGHGIELPEAREKLGKPRAGKITISVNQSDDRVIISVKDDGCGININRIKEKAIKDNIIEKSIINKFTKFDLLNIIFRPGFSTEDKVTEISGRGMGLDIVNNKIKNLNGKIKIITEKGKGTEIILDLPTDKYLLSDKSEASNKEISDRKQIVLVDDSRATRTYFSKILENGGYKCISFDSAKQALSYLKETDCDLIITDIEMPHINGYEFVSKLKREKSLKDIPILVISMLSKENAIKKFKELTIENFVNKSDFTPEKFVKIVSDILKK